MRHHKLGFVEYISEQKFCLIFKSNRSVAVFLTPFFFLVLKKYGITG